MTKRWRVTITELAWYAVREVEAETEEAARELALELFRGIPQSALWIVLHGAHGPIFGPLAGPFAAAALAHLSGRPTQPQA